MSEGLDIGFGLGLGVVFVLLSPWQPLTMADRRCGWSKSFFLESPSQSFCKLTNSSAMFTHFAPSQYFTCGFCLSILQT